MANRVMWIVWPAFLAACVLELLVFAVVDPQDLHWGDQALALSRQAVYTGAFFAFWLVTMGACFLTTLLRLSPAELNRCPYEPAERPSNCPGGSGAIAS
jgi:hypothetical protein